MPKKNLDPIIKKTAAHFGVNEEKVLSEIEFMIRDVQKSLTPEQREIWNQIPREGDLPSPKEFIEFCTNYLTEQKKNAH